MARRIDFGRRNALVELIDTEPVGFEELRRCLHDLETANRWSFAYRPTLAWLDRLLKRRGPAAAGPLSVLDVGCGYGDTLRRVWRWATARGVAVELVGVDVNPLAKQAAALATPPGWPIGYEVANVFELAPERRFDAVISSLFAHHLSDAELVRFLRWMEERAAIGWFISDLHRHPVSYHFLRVFFPALRFHRLCVHDGPVSVARAFGRDDWRRLIAEAGIDRAAVRIAWHVPFRFGVGRLR